MKIISVLLFCVQQRVALSIYYNLLHYFQTTPGSVEPKDLATILQRRVYLVLYLFLSTNLTNNLKQA